MSSNCTIREGDEVEHVACGIVFRVARMETINGRPNLFDDNGNRFLAKNCRPVGDGAAGDEWNDDELIAAVCRVFGYECVKRNHPATYEAVKRAVDSALISLAPTEGRERVVSDVDLAGTEGSYSVEVIASVGQNGVEIVDERRVDSELLSRGVVTVADLVNGVPETNGVKGERAKRPTITVNAPVEFVRTEELEPGTLNEQGEFVGISAINGATVHAERSPVELFVANLSAALVRVVLKYSAGGRDELAAAITTQIVFELGEIPLMPVSQHKAADDIRKEHIETLREKIDELLEDRAHVRREFNGLCAAVSNLISILPLPKGEDRFAETTWQARAVNKINAIESRASHVNELLKGRANPAHGEAVVEVKSYGAPQVLHDLDVVRRELGSMIERLGSMIERLGGKKLAEVQS